MNDWPDGMDVAPLREWPGTLTPADKRRGSAFSARMSETLQMLSRELRALHAGRAELLVAIEPAQFRLDGRPRAGATAAHPGVVLSFTAQLGRLAYPCDRFTTWQDNLRAIALSLEALRKVDRYGVTAHGEQYRGFLAIEARPRQAGKTTEHAIEVLAQIANVPWDPAWSEIPDYVGDLVARAKRAAHPDLGGSTDLFQQVIDAERVLTGKAA